MKKQGDYKKLFADISIPSDHIVKEHKIPFGKWLFCDMDSKMSYRTTIAVTITVTKYLKFQMATTSTFQRKMIFAMKKHKWQKIYICRNCGIKQTQIRTFRAAYLL